MTQSSSSTPAVPSMTASTVGDDQVGSAGCRQPSGAAEALGTSGDEADAGTTPPPASRRSLLRRLGGAARRGSSSGASWSSVGTTAVAKVVVMGVSGVFGLVNTSLIIRHF